jgi:hypothetical protein
MNQLVVCNPRNVVEVSELDSLVAAYAPLGRAVRRRRKRRRMTWTFGALAVAGAIGLSLRAGMPPLTVIRQLGQLGDLHALVESELGALSAQRAELEAQVRRYEEESRSLKTALDELEGRYAALEAQQKTLSAQSTELRDAFAASSEKRKPGGSDAAAKMQHELSAISAERRALEERWQHFAEQSKDLSRQLEALDAQRRTLEADRQAAQDGPLDADPLSDAQGVGAGMGARGGDAAADGTMDSALLSAELTADAIDPTALGDMRGGIMIGGGMNVAVGLTRIATVNGEERYANTLQLGDLAHGLDAASLGNVNRLLIQNGPGNVFLPSAFGSTLGGLGTVVQNSLDDQNIRTSTIYDVSIQDVGRAVQGLSATRALTDSLNSNLNR